MLLKVIVISSLCAFIASYTNDPYAVMGKKVYNKIIPGEMNFALAEPISVKN